MEDGIIGWFGDVVADARVRSEDCSDPDVPRRGQEAKHMERMGLHVLLGSDSISPWILGRVANGRRSACTSVPLRSRTRAMLTTKAPGRQGALPRAQRARGVDVGVEIFCESRAVGCVCG